MRSTAYPVHRRLLLLACWTLVCWACQNPSSNNNASSRTPQSSEEVFRNWQGHIDRNEFDQAKKLSTASTVEWIDMISTMLFDLPEGEEIPLTQFIELSCSESGDTASCRYLTEEEGFQIRDSVRLIRQDGQWLVDFTDEEELSEEEAEEIIQELKELMQDSLRQLENLQ
ncbi:MAG: hypothetical protein AAFV95_02475 [Bacteroidota bacterium]